MRRSARDGTARIRRRELLFDENLSPRLGRESGGPWPDCPHVEMLGLRRASGEAIWTFAQAQGFMIVGKDDDFRALALVRGAPPLVIWLQVGNASTTRIGEILKSSAAEIAAFAQDPHQALLILRG